MYTSVVMMLAGLIGKILSVETSTVWVTELPEAEQIIQICEAIVIARSEENVEE